MSRKEVPIICLSDDEAEERQSSSFKNNNNHCTNSVIKMEHKTENNATNSNEKKRIKPISIPTSCEIKYNFDKLASSVSSRRVPAVVLTKISSAAVRNASTPVAPSVNPNAELFEKYIIMCKKTHQDPEMDIIINKLVKAYNAADSAYKASPLFRDLLSKELSASTKVGFFIFPSIRTVRNDLKSNKKSNKPINTDLPKTVTVTENKMPEETPTLPVVEPVASCSKDQEQEQQNNEEDSETDSLYGLSDKRRKQVKKLDKCLRGLGKAIKILEEREVDFEKEDNSSYMKLCKYKDKFVKVYAKKCQLLNKAADADRPCKRKVTFSGTRYKDIEKAVEKVYNHTRRFPDFKDIHKIVKEVRKDCGYKAEHLQNIAVDVFKRFGELLKMVRQRDDYDIACSYTTGEVDPALSDESLKERLDNNYKIFKEKEEQVIKKYVSLSSNEQPEEVKSGESESEGEEENDEEDEEVHTPKMEAKKKRILSSDSDTDSGAKRSKKSCAKDVSNGVKRMSTESFHSESEPKTNGSEKNNGDNKDCDLSQESMLKSLDLKRISVSPAPRSADMLNSASPAKRNEAKHLAANTKEDNSAVEKKHFLPVKNLPNNKNIFENSNKITNEKDKNVILLPNYESNSSRETVLPDRVYITDNSSEIRTEYKVNSCVQKEYNNEDDKDVFKDILIKEIGSIPKEVFDNNGIPNESKRNLQSNIKFIDNEVCDVTSTCETTPVPNEIESITNINDQYCQQHSIVNDDKESEIKKPNVLEVPTSPLKVKNVPEDTISDEVCILDDDDDDDDGKNEDVAIITVEPDVMVIDDGDAEIDNKKFNPTATSTSKKPDLGNAGKVSQSSYTPVRFLRGNSNKLRNVFLRPGIGGVTGLTPERTRLIEGNRAMPVSKTNAKQVIANGNAKIFMKGVRNCKNVQSGEVITLD